MCVFQRISFPSAIAHIDCNAYFASVEQAYNPQLKGQPVMVLGMGGGCVITASYEARKYGVSTGMTIKEAKQLCPHGVFVEGDFKKYLLYHQRFLEILSTFTPTIESSSIDEAFIDLKGLRRLYRQPYQEICLKIKETIKQQLGITVSIGLSTSKILAKMASDFKKPDALTVVTGKDIKHFLEQQELSDIPGVGRNTHSLFTKFNIQTPLQLALADSRLLQKISGKNGLELQQELKGNSVKPVNPLVAPPKSLSRTRSFRLTHNPQIIYAELLKNLELAFWQLRSQKVKTTLVIIMLRDEHYHVHGQEIPLEEAINCQSSIHFRVKQAFQRLYRPDLQYRSSGIITTKLIPEERIMPTLFGQELDSPQTVSLFSQIDKINHKYGRQTICFAAAKRAPIQRRQIDNLQNAFIGFAN